MSANKEQTAPPASTPAVALTATKLKTVPSTNGSGLSALRNWYLDEYYPKTGGKKSRREVDFADQLAGYKGTYPAAVRFENNRYGYVDKDLNVVIAPNFNDAGRFNDEDQRAVVTINGLGFLIDITGKILNPDRPVKNLKRLQTGFFSFTNESELEQILVPTACGFYDYGIHDYDFSVHYYGLMDKNGNVVIEPDTYRALFPTANPRHYFAMKDNLLGIVSITGEIIRPFEFGNIVPLYDVKHKVRPDGALVPVYHVCEHRDHWTKKGKMVLPLNYILNADGQSLVQPDYFASVELSGDLLIYYGVAQGWSIHDLKNNLSVLKNHDVGFHGCMLSCDIINRPEIGITVFRPDMTQYLHADFRYINQREGNTLNYEVHSQGPVKYSLIPGWCLSNDNVYALENGFLVRPLGSGEVHYQDLLTPDGNETVFKSFWQINHLTVAGFDVAEVRFISDQDSRGLIDFKGNYLVYPIYPQIIPMFDGVACYHKNRKTDEWIFFAIHPKDTETPKDS
ncbi:MAG: WG repeat-containing protein [Sutterellaceae bacterium]|nr:WG repeat-containing protein [Sutterellaceae bacterium]